MVFKLPKTEMSWSEPYFFLLRIREGKSWLKRGLLVLGIAALMFGATQINQKQAQKLGLLGALGISLAAGLVLVAYLDCGNIQRDVTIYDDSVGYNSSVHMGIVTRGTFDFKTIQQVVLMRPREWPMPFGGMLIQSGDEGFLLAVPNKVSLETVANLLHRLGVSVKLSGWEASETDTRVQVMDEVAVALPATNYAAGTAKIWDVAPEDGPLVPGSAVAMSLVVGLTPLVIALIAAIAAVVYLIMKWSLLSVMERSVVGGGAFVVLVLGFVYLVLIGQFLANRIEIEGARKHLQLRPNALFTDDESLVAMTIYDRAAWTAAIAKATDEGFLQIDRSRGVLRFEGKKQRWEIPVAALSACRIEEARVGSEATENPEKRYFVVIASMRDGQPWEAGMKPTPVELGNDNAERRHERAKRLLAEIGTAVKV